MIDWVAKWLKKAKRVPQGARASSITVASDRKFEQRSPRAQNEIDLFATRWASDLSKVVAETRSGVVDHFTSDPRPSFAMSTFGRDLAGPKLRILELGPLEGGHTFQFEKLGVDEIVAVEANVEAFLKCLIVKNLTGLQKSRFLLGDFVEYLKEDQSRYDFIFCCGVLYHMQDPLELVELMAAHTDRIFVWTHYHTEDVHPGLVATPVACGNETYIYHRLPYVGRELGTFWGGNKSYSSWLSRDDVFRAFRQHGFVNFELHEEDLRHPGGPCFSISFWR